MCRMDCVFPRLQTNADHPGVERLTVTQTIREYQLHASLLVSATEIMGEPCDLTDGCSVFMIKGWTRSIAAFTVMLAAWESPEFLQAGESEACSVSQSVAMLQRRGRRTFRSCLVLRVRDDKRDGAPAVSPGRSPPSNATLAWSWGRTTPR